MCRYGMSSPREPHRVIFFMKPLKLKHQKEPGCSTGSQRSGFFFVLFYSQFHCVSAIFFLKKKISYIKTPQVSLNFLLSSSSLYFSASLSLCRWGTLYDFLFLLCSNLHVSLPSDLPLSINKGWSTLSAFVMWAKCNFSSTTHYHLLIIILQWVSKGFDHYLLIGPEVGCGLKPNLKF